MYLFFFMNMTLQCCLKTACLNPYFFVLGFWTKLDHRRVSNNFFKYVVQISIQNLQSELLKDNELDLMSELIFTQRKRSENVSEYQKLSGCQTQKCQNPNKKFGFQTSQVTGRVRPVFERCYRLASSFQVFVSRTLKTV